MISDPVVSEILKDPRRRVKFYLYRSVIRMVMSMPLDLGADKKKSRSLFSI